MKNIIVRLALGTVGIAIMASWLPVSRAVHHTLRAALADTQQVMLTVSLAANKPVLNADSITITVTIKNNGTVPAKLPDIFTNLKSNLYPSVTNEDGRAVTPIKLAITDFSGHSTDKYIILSKGAQLKKTIDLSILIKQMPIPARGGRCVLEVSYTNNYGADCVKGVFYSNLLPFNVAPTLHKPVLSPGNAPHTVSVYSNVVTFVAKKDTTPVKPFKPLTNSTNKTGTFTDERDGQVYTWVTVGKQTWMSQNLNYKTKNGHSYYPGSDSSNANKFGMFYDFAALAEACPKGWHLPSDKEWQQLELAGGLSPDRVGKDTRDGDDISAFVTGGVTGFNVLYAGLRRAKWEHANERAYFWATEEYNDPQYLFRRIFIKDTNQLIRATQGKAFALSIRCVKDE